MLQLLEPRLVVRPGRTTVPVPSRMQGATPSPTSDLLVARSVHRVLATWLLTLLPVAEVSAHPRAPPSTHEQHPYGLPPKLTTGMRLVGAALTNPVQQELTNEAYGDHSTDARGEGVPARLAPRSAAPAMSAAGPALRAVFPRRAVRVPFDSVHRRAA